MGTIEQKQYDTLHVLINGPEGCGKSELVKYLKKYLTVAEHQCKHKLHELTIAFFDADPDDYYRLYSIQENKNTPSPLFIVEWDAYDKLVKFLGKEYREPLPDGRAMLSIREAMIYVSEILCKPTFGKEYFGVTRLDALRGSQGKVHITVDDSTGFEEELYPLLREVPQRSLLLIRIHGRGEYSVNDSRGYIRDGVIDHVLDIDNVESEQKFHETVLDYLYVAMGR